MAISAILMILICSTSVLWVYRKYCQKQLRQDYVSSMRAVSTALSRRAPPSAKPFIVRVNNIQNTDMLQAEISVRSVIKKNLKEDESDYVKDISIVPTCMNRGALTALVDFEKLPRFLDRLATDTLQKESRESCSVQLTESISLTFDADFLGFTQMYRTTAKPNVDIVFITGLGSHAYGSWVSKSEPFRMWPRHFLQKHFPNARVMLYGYRAVLAGTSFEELLDYSRTFCGSLKQVRKEDPSRPIIFVAHSFGGNLLKSFLVKDHQHGGMTLRVTHGIVFFAVPHRGMDVEDMMAAIKHVEAGVKVSQISLESEWRRELDSFIDVIRDCKISSFYETKLTRRLKQKLDGSFARDGELAKALSPHSATLGLPNDMERKYPVDADHSTIIKFGNDSIPAFLQALACLEELVTRVKKCPIAPSAREYISNPGRYFNYNYGTGAQTIFQGTGNQYINLSGTQYNGQVQTWGG